MLDANDTNFIDPRVNDAALCATENEPDESYGSQLRDNLTAASVRISDIEKTGTEKDERIYIDFEPNDPQNPFNFSRRRKWIMTLTACFFTALSTSASSSYNQGFATMIPELHTTSYVAGIGLAAYCAGFGVVPLVTASLSEEFGRMPLYVVSAAGFALTHLMIALAPNMATVIAGRFLNGAFGSTGATMVSGSIADIWVAKDRGFAMAIYSVAATCSTGVGAMIAAFVATSLGWRWIQWIHCIITGVYTLLIPVLLYETRAGVILTRIAKRTREETGDYRIQVRVENKRASLRALVWVSCTRPVYLLVTEPVVASFSIWIGFGWGLLFGMIDSIGPVFRELHGFSTNDVGLAFLTLSMGSLLGFTAALCQERLYAHKVSERGPEARLYLACAAALVFPAGMFIYAWCAFTSVHWIGLCVGIVVYIAAIFVIYAAVFSYLADVYGPFALSALAGQSLARNLAGAAFPLFVTQLFDRLGYPWGNTLFALLAVVLAPVPYILFFFGPKLRARSKFASMVKH